MNLIQQGIMRAAFHRAQQPKTKTGPGQRRLENIHKEIARKEDAALNRALRRVRAAQAQT